ncbi:MAG: DUF1330 domain-containing protein [Promethearchaeota archaeon]
MSKLPTDINQEQFKEFTENSNQKPFVMLNLLKFKKDGGQEDYFRYLKESSSFGTKIGASVDYFGIPKELLTGTQEWDLIMLIRYPSRKAFLEMINNPDYLKAHEWRKKGVERAVLYATDPAKFMKTI